MSNGGSLRMKTASTSAEANVLGRAEDGVRWRVAHLQRPDAREDVAVLHEQIAQLAVERLVPPRLCRTLERESRILVGQNAIHRIHHVDEPHMRISSVAQPSAPALPFQGPHRDPARLASRSWRSTPPRSRRRRRPPTRRAPRVERSPSRTDHADATRAALDVDGGRRQRRRRAVAAALALGVVNPSASGIGGGGFALVYTAADRKVTVLDFRETAPASYSADVLSPPKKPTDPPPLDRFGWTGPRGGVGGRARRAGRARAPLASLRQALARRGRGAGRRARAERLLREQAHGRGRGASSRRASQTLPSLASSFLPGGTARRARQRASGGPSSRATLAALRRRGEEVDLRGPDRAEDRRCRARRRRDDDARGSRRLRGQGARAALADHRRPHRLHDARALGGRAHAARDARRCTARAARRRSCRSGFGSSAYLHTVAEAMRGAIADRARLRAAIPISIRRSTRPSPTRSSPRSSPRGARASSPTKTHAPAEFKTQGAGHEPRGRRRRRGQRRDAHDHGERPVRREHRRRATPASSSTTSSTTSRRRDDAAAFGLKDGGPNRPRPRARPVSSMTPTLVLEGGVPILALGGSGGTRIATGATQAALARLALRPRSERVRLASARPHAGRDALRRSGYRAGRARGPARRAARR